MTGAPLSGGAVVLILLSVLLVLVGGAVAMRRHRSAGADLLPQRGDQGKPTASLAHASALANSVFRWARSGGATPLVNAVPTRPVAELTVPQIAEVSERPLTNLERRGAVDRGVLVRAHWFVCLHC